MSGKRWFSSFRLWQPSTYPLKYSRRPVGNVTFAARCVYEGHVVPHLVVRMPQGPVTVLLLRHRSVGETVRIAEQGYTGVVMPAPRGSIAVVGRGQKDLDAIARQVFEAVDWGG